MHRELAQPHAEQQLGNRVRPPFRRTQRPARLRGRRPDRLRDQVQHGRMQRVVEVRDAVVRAVDRQRVLDQVVGADRQEVSFSTNAARIARPPALRSCRRSAPGRRTSACAPSAAPWRARPRRAPARFRRGREHRHQNAHRADFGRPKDRAQLREEEFGIRRGSSGSRAGQAPGWIRAGARRAPCRGCRADAVSTLSAPMSSVRITTGLPFRPGRRWHRLVLLVLAGQGAGGFMNRNSLRKSPMPAAPISCSSPAEVREGSSTLACSCTVVPSSVCRRARSSACL